MDTPAFIPRSDHRHAGTFTPAFVMTYGGPNYATTYAPLLVTNSPSILRLCMAAAALIVIYLVLVIAIAGVLNIVSGWGDNA